MSDIELNICALNASNTSAGNFVVVLQEWNGSRRLPILIGLQEAQAIAVALEKMHPVRPLTHDLLLNTINQLGGHLQSVKICGTQDDSYRSVIVLTDSGNNIIEIDSRTSDAIALAVRQNCPIYISDHLLDKMAAGLQVDGKIFSDKRGQLEQYTLDELYEMLTNLLQKEDYESAAIIRDIISKKEPR